MDNGLWILGIVAVLALLALAVWLRSRKKESYRLPQRFGADQGNAVDVPVNSLDAEAVLKAHATRV